MEVLGLQRGPLYPHSEMCQPVGAGQETNMFSLLTLAHSVVQTYLYTGSALQIFIQSFETYQPACKMSVNSWRHLLSWQKDKENKKSWSSPPGTKLKVARSRYHFFQRLTLLMAHFKHSDRTDVRFWSSIQILCKDKTFKKFKTVKRNKLSKSVWKAIPNVFIGCVLHMKELRIGKWCHRMTGEHLPINLFDW